MAPEDFNQLAAKEDLALSAFHAIAKQTIGGLAQGLEIENRLQMLVMNAKAAATQSRIEQCISGTGQSVSASIGATNAPQDGITYHEIVSAAD